MRLRKLPHVRPATVAWVGDLQGHVEIIDQRLLPNRVVVLRLTTVEEIWEAIKTLAVRGAPAIGVTAAFGMVIAGRDLPGSSRAAHLLSVLRDRGEYLKSCRPTAINLAWAVQRMINAAEAARGVGVRPMQTRLLEEARAIWQEDLERCAAIGRHGASLIQPNSGILTHCNAGALAASDHGTALAPLYEAHRQGVPFQVFADETRPLLQGARLTAWELQNAGIDVTLICDNMAGMVMAQKKIDLVIVGADRITANGDVANKIGTYSVATLAHAHHIPFVVAAPSSTFDLSLSDGTQIPIEERGEEEITKGLGKQTAPKNIKVYNPAFDVTPASLVHAIITEKGLISPVNETTIRALLKGC